MSLVIIIHNHLLRITLLVHEGAIWGTKAQARLDEAETDELLGEVLIRLGIERCGRDGREALIPRHPVDETIVEQVALRAGRFVQRHICSIESFISSKGAKRNYLLEYAFPISASGFKLN